MNPSPLVFNLPSRWLPSQFCFCLVVVVVVLVGLWESCIALIHWSRCWAHMCLSHKPLLGRLYQVLRCSSGFCRGKGSYISVLSHIWVEVFDKVRIRMCSHFGRSMSLGAGFEVSKVHAVDQDVALKYHVCHAPHHDDNGQSFWIIFIRITCPH